jgi:hypothetical protein
MSREPHQPLTEQPDYKRGVAAERAAIVAWLRRYALQRDSDWASDSYSTLIANAIEQGAQHD